MVIYPHVLNIIIAIGRPGSMYPTTSSVMTFNPTCWFVIAWIIPTGRVYTNEMIKARQKAQIGSWVCQISIEAQPKMNMTTKMVTYHHSGTCLYLLISLA